MNSIKKLLKNLGPGVITGASDDDPSGIATYSQAGARFGFSQLWTAWVTFILMFSIQEMCARISIVTSKDLIKNIKAHYPPIVLYLTLLFCVPAIIFNIAADLAAMGAATHLIIPAVSSTFFCIFYAIAIIYMLIVFKYKKIENLLKYACLVLFLYIVIPFLVKQNWKEVLYHSFIPEIHFNKEYIGMLVAILGTTISPYLFFWQATMEVEEGYHAYDRRSTLHILKDMRWDVGIGMFFSNIVMYFIILTTGSTLFKNGLTVIETLSQASEALKPLAGNLCYLLFTLGIVGTGLLAIPVFSSCVSYIITSSFEWKEGLNKKFYNAKIFYSIIIISIVLSLLINFSEMNPVKALIYTAMLYGVSAPPIILMILLIANNKKIMGKYTNGKKANLFGIITFILMLLSAMLLIYYQF